MTGICSFLEQCYFWASNTRLECTSSDMSKGRSLESKYLHVTYNSIQLNRAHVNSARDHTVCPLLNIAKGNFQSIPKQEKLSVDEQIIPFKGKGIMKQHMLNKPNRCGYTKLVLAASDSSLCYEFIFYASKNSKQEHRSCTDIALDVCETVSRSVDHKADFDNSFITIRLQMELKKLVYGRMSAGHLTHEHLPAGNSSS